MTINFDVHSMIAGFLDAREESDLLEQLGRTTWDLGFERFAMGHHVDLVGSPEDAIRLTDYDADWIDRALAERYYLEDPIHAASLQTAAGFLWSDVPKMVPLSNRQQIILDAAQEYGLAQGYTVPVNVAGEYRGTCSFGAATDERLRRDALPCAQLAGIYSFEAARRMLYARHTRRNELKRIPTLTGRQRDALVLLARGKGDFEIGMLLGISARTAREHIENIRKAYGYVQRTYLIARALFDGQISFFEVFRR